MQKILIVDDEENIVSLIEYNLKNAGFQTIAAYDGRKAVTMAREQRPDLIVLDVMLPGMDGFDVVRELRKESNVPVLMLTARAEEFDRVLALELGADDYLIKPFSTRELVARVKAILRRVTSEPREEEKAVIKAGPITVDVERHEVHVDEKEIQLTAKEYELLKLLVTNRGRVFSREKLLEQLWDYDYFGDTRTIDVHMRHLREKIEQDSANPRYLKTIRGVGYKFEE
ncbi:response regulator transcription factor [Candidatus Formimonas warabiya]|uniref:Stage 0 sporulation protein A homolog n=1 Tax=Formimonas warabiya TaxID=1761012 RepID=A0A3G1KN30_FORW1|nr:response regulator transcription factor [Candidatus Formimonas warabiya]ATW23867.1 DNA-binding response regulator [Candidatus Formimonas warabiya]